MSAPKLASLSLVVGLVLLVACAQSTSSSRPNAASPNRSKSTEAPKPDPRVSLRGGKTDAAEATWNLRVVSETPPSPQFIDGINSDLAFIGRFAVQGSFNGYQVWDIGNPSLPT